jgi:hypothetical protein
MAPWHATVLVTFADRNHEPHFHFLQLLHTACTQRHPACCWRFALLPLLC